MDVALTVNGRRHPLAVDPRTTLLDLVREDPVCQRLMTVPGIGAVAATALAATVGDATVLESGRHLAAWLGLVPRQTSSGGKERLGGISKAGDGYLRRLLVHGARAVMRWHGTKSSWLSGLLKRRPFNVAVVALANKLARIAWAVMARGEDYRKPEAAAEPAQG